MDTLDLIFNEMDTDNNGAIDSKEFVENQFRAFKNCEDNLEFLTQDIERMDDEIKEVSSKL